MLIENSSTKALSVVLEVDQLKDLQCLEDYRQKKYTESKAYHTISGYLSWCQDQLPEQVMQYLHNTWYENLSDIDRFSVDANSLAQQWKDLSISFRRSLHIDSTKNESHPGQDNYHRLFSPFETEILLNKLEETTFPWYLKEKQDYEYDDSDED